MPRPRSASYQVNKPMTEPTKPFDFSFRVTLLRDPENAALYLAEYFEEGAKAQEGGVRAVAIQADVSRENLCNALSKNGKPQMETVTKMLSAPGLRFTIVAAH